jgi:hypothetical protein
MALWFVVGLLTGTLHIVLLWWGAQPPLRGIVAGAMRLLGVALLLVVAALMGHLFPAACGWGGGFIVSAIGASLWKAL